MLINSTRDYENTSSLDFQNVREVCRPEFKKITVRGKLVDVCYFNMPGDKGTRHCGIVDEAVKRRFPREWLAYTNGDVLPLNGTPIEQMPGIGERLATEMKATGLLTVENLRDLNDHGCKSYLNGVGLRERARIFLANKKPEETAQLKAELEEIKAQMAQLLAAQKPQAKTVSK